MTTPRVSAVRRAGIALGFVACAAVLFAIVMGFVALADGQVIGGIAVIVVAALGGAGLGLRLRWRVQHFHDV